MSCLFADAARLTHALPQEEKQRQPYTETEAGGKVKKRICHVKSIYEKLPRMHDIDDLLLNTLTGGVPCGGECCSGEVQQEKEEEEGEDPAL